MSQPLISTEAVGGGVLTRGKLRWNYLPVHLRIDLPNDAEHTLLIRTQAGWLWTHRHGVVAGRAAAALHGAK
jgi:hypothetical protein